MIFKARIQRTVDEVCEIEIEGESQREAYLLAHEIMRCLDYPDRVFPSLSIARGVQAAEKSWKVDHEECDIGDLIITKLSEKER